jgi:signal transduction histidine kinase
MQAVPPGFPKAFFSRLVRLCVPQHLGGQLVAVVSAVLWVAIALFGLYTVRVQDAAALSALERDAAAMARSLALACENAVAAEEPLILERLILRSAAFPHVQEIRVVDPRGASLTRAVHPDGQPPRTVVEPAGSRLPVPANAVPLLQMDSELGPLHAWHPIGSGQLLGWMRVDHSTAEMLQMRQSTQVSMLIACLLAGLCNAVLLRAVLRKPLRAIDRARDFAHGLMRIEGQQLAIVDGTLETRALGASLNQASMHLLQMREAKDANLADLRRQEAALADTNEQLRTIFALSPDALVCFDANDRVSHTNAAFHRLTGLPVGKVLNYPAAALEMRLRKLCIAAHAFPGLDAYFPAQGDPHSRSQPQRLTLARPHHAVLEVVGALSDAPSARRLLYLRDITHESEVDRMKSEFLSTAAHELRTPMTSIHACVELMLTREFDAARRNKMLTMMQRQSHVLRSVVDELLDLARIEARGGADFVFGNVDLGELTAQVVHDFVVPDGRSAPQIEALERPVAVRVDRQKSAQVLRNLLSNAYKYSPPETPVHVRLLAADSHGRAGVEVQDFGIGMSPEQLARVGERFYRADASGHVLGTGLGVSIVREILGLMGGTMVLESTLGEGTRAIVRLPVVTTGELRPGVASRAASGGANLAAVAAADAQTATAE